jgi:uncharacterized RDD family membrane protein YckC
MPDDTMQCPACAATIKAEAKVCRFCGAQFEQTLRGYCQTDHDTVDVDEFGRCRKCGNPVIDRHTESRVIAGSGVAASDGGITEWVIEPIRGEGVNWRFNGVFLDLILIEIIFAVVAVVMATLATSLETVMSEADFAAIFGGPALFLLPVFWFLYFFLFEAISGATPGKRGSFVKVIRKDGGKIQWWQAAIRSFLSFFEYNIIGAVVIWSTPLKQRIGDLIAGTLVVNHQKIHKLEFRPNFIGFEFHDYRRVEFAKITDGVIRKFGLARQLTLNGISPQGEPVTLKWNAQFQRREFERIRREIERRSGFSIPEKIILWRLFIVIFTLLFGFLGIALLLWSANQ